MLASTSQSERDVVAVGWPQDEGNVVTCGRLYVEHTLCDQGLHASWIEGDVEFSTCAGPFD